MFTRETPEGHCLRKAPALSGQFSYLPQQSAPGHRETRQMPRAIERREAQKQRAGHVSVSSAAEHRRLQKVCPWHPCSWEARERPTPPEAPSFM